MFKFSEINFYKVIEKIKNRGLNLRSLFSYKKKAKETIDYSFYRKIVADLLFKVLTNKMLVREALLKFPEDIQDPSIQASWHALCHLESDEDIRRRDFEYAEEQNDFIEMIAFTLQRGEELPENIINSYTKYHEEALIPHSKGLKGIVKKLTRFLNI